MCPLPPWSESSIKVDLMPPAFLESEFDLAWCTRTQAHRKHLAAAGVTFEAMLRAGDLGVARIATTGRLYMPAPDGFPVLIMAIWSPAPPSIYCAVEDPEILDLIALRTDDPGRWWYRMGEPGLILGEDHYLDAIGTSAQLKAFESPLDWLRGDCNGSVFLDDAEARWTNERLAEDRVALQDWWSAAS